MWNYQWTTWVKTQFESQSLVRINSKRWKINMVEGLLVNLAIGVGVTIEFLESELLHTGRNDNYDSISYQSISTSTNFKASDKKKGT